MSNASIIARIEDLIRQLEAREISCGSFAQQFEAHFPALENLEFQHFKAAQRASLVMEIAERFEDGGFEDFFEDSTESGVVTWFRNWLQSVPQ